MNIFKAIFKGIKEYGDDAIEIAALLGVPYASTIDKAIKIAQRAKGPGTERATLAFNEFIRLNPNVEKELAAKIGVDSVPLDAAVAYITGQIELHYQLLKATGKLE